MKAIFQVLLTILCLVTTSFSDQKQKIHKISLIDLELDIKQMNDSLVHLVGKYYHGSPNIKSFEESSIYFRIKRVDEQERWVRKRLLKCHDYCYMNAIFRVEGRYLVFEKINEVLLLTGKWNSKTEPKFRHALALDSTDATEYGRLATYLYDYKKDYKNAEYFYERALHFDSTDTYNLGSYATFQQCIKKNKKLAEKLFKKAIALGSKDANLYGNLAKLLFEQGKNEEGAEYLKSAFSLNQGKHPILSLELWFYEFALGSSDREVAKANIEKLLSQGAFSKDWDLREIVQMALRNGHSEKEKLFEYSKRISGLSIPGE